MIKLKRFAKLFSAMLIAAILMMSCSGVLTVCADDKSVVSEGFINVGEETLPVHVLHKACNDNEGFILLLLGDGYTQSEQKKFTDFAEKCAETFVSTEPFASFSNKINIYAVPTVSDVSGISGYNYPVDTYFGVKYYNGVVDFDVTRGGLKKARAIKNALEESYLDKGAEVMRIHVVSNSDFDFGAAPTGNMLYSFASQHSLYTNGEASLHELAHSIGKLADEYGAYSIGPNTSDVNNADSVQWRDMLGFRGIGITLNGNAAEGSDKACYIPTLSCIMKDAGNSGFCEVCKLELVRRMNILMYPRKLGDYYIAAPDVTIEHSGVNAIGSEYEKCRINEKNIERANGYDLEFRTVVQNLAKKELRLKVRFEITDESGEVKRSAESVEVVPALENSYNPEAATVYVSAVIENAKGLSAGDKISASVVDVATDTCLATDKTEQNGVCKVNIHHKIKDENGEVSEMKNVSTTSVYVPKSGKYKLNSIEKLNGYTYIGNSLGENEAEISENTDVDYYYRVFDGEAGTKTTVSDDGKTFSINAKNINGGSMVLLALYDGDKLGDIKIFTYNGDEIKYTTNTPYTKAKVMVWKDMNSLVPMCDAEKTGAVR